MIRIHAVYVTYLILAVLGKALGSNMYAEFQKLIGAHNA
jgi:hypothetical protein